MKFTHLLLLKVSVFPGAPGDNLQKVNQIMCRKNLTHLKTVNLRKRQMMCRKKFTQGSLVCESNRNLYQLST